MKTLIRNLFAVAWALVTSGPAWSADPGELPLKSVVLSKLDAPAGKFSAALLFEGSHDFKTGDLKVPFVATGGEFKVTKFEVGGTAALPTIGDLQVGDKKWKVLSLGPKEMKRTEGVKKFVVEAQAEVVIAQADAGFSESYLLNLDEKRLDWSVTVKNASGIDWTSSKTRVLLQEKTAGVVSRLVREFELGKLKNGAEAPPDKKKLSVDVGADNALVRIEPTKTSPTNDRIVRLQSGFGADVRANVPKGTSLTIRGAASALLPAQTLAADLTMATGCDACQGACAARTDRAYLTVGTNFELTSTPKIKSAGAWLPLAIVEDQLLYLDAQPLEVCIDNRGAKEQVVELFTETASKGVFADVCRQPAKNGPGGTPGKFSDNRWLFDCTVKVKSTKTPDADLKKLAADLPENLEKVLAEAKKNPELKKVLQSIGCIDERIRKQIGTTPDEAVAYFEKLLADVRKIKTAARRAMKAEALVKKLRERQAALAGLELASTPKPGTNSRYVRPVSFLCEEQHLRSALDAALAAQQAADLRFFVAISGWKTCSVGGCPPLLGGRLSTPNVAITPLPLDPIGWKITGPKAVKKGIAAVDTAKCVDKTEILPAP